MAMVPNNLKWSLPVPNVQALASQQLDTVPHRYLRDDTNDIIINVPTDQSTSVPLIDMAKLVNPETIQAELQKLHSACKDWGVFQNLLRNMKKQVRDFFELPLQEKQRWAQKPGSNEGYGHMFIASEEQKLEWNDILFLKVVPIHSDKMNFWPDNPHDFRETMMNYVESMRQVAMSVARFISMMLEITDPEFYQAYRDGNYDIRMNFYPPCPQPERVIGLSPRTDVHGITLLLDCGHSPALQVLKDGQWVFVQPMDHALVVNLGGIIEIVSNGVYKSPTHRAVVNRSKERVSIVTLCNPNPSLRIGPLIKSGTPPLYQTVTLGEYFECFYNSKPGVPYMDKLKI